MSYTIIGMVLCAKVEISFPFSAKRCRILHLHPKLLQRTAKGSEEVKDEQWLIISFCNRVGRTFNPI
jgi:hypothetical protein